MQKNLKSNREVKASAFTAFFNVPENAAKLYAALNEKEEVLPEDITYTTLSGVLFMARKNDMAFHVKNKVLVISEHQSTINENMPLRDVIYYGRTMEKLIEAKNIYKSSRINIPTPEFYVFYNGKENNFPKEKILRLSDSYIEETKEPMLELIVRVININLLSNHPILEKCRPLYEYAWFVQKIREYQDAGKNLSEAIACTIEECVANGIMTEFIRENGSEAVNMLFTQFNMDDALEVRYEEGIEKGIEKGIDILIQTCQEMGLSREEVYLKIKQKYEFSDDKAEEYLKKYFV